MVPAQDPADEKYCGLISLRVSINPVRLPVFTEGQPFFLGTTDVGNCQNSGNLDFNQNDTFAAVKQIISLFLVCCIIGQASVRTLWVVHYQWNRAAYLAHCENKSKPQLHCDGKCFLKKRMQAKTDDSPNEPQLPESFRQIKDLQLYIIDAPGFLLDPVIVWAETTYPLFLCSIAEPPIRRLFRPPAA